ncbi:MAG: AAA family ATPase [Sandaracinaceae bacterium]|nr:AAA family ATPase [Sandaracinaceae bacterium]
MSNDAASSSPSLGAPVTGTHRVAARGEAACAGREAELARLTALYRDVQRDGGERLVLLEGPGGIGKSRILAELRSRVRLQGGVVLEGRCEPGRAFGPFADIVDRALRFLDEVGVAPTIDLSGLACRGGCHRLWHLHGADSTALSADPQGATPETAAFERRLRFFDAINALLTEVAAVRAPVVVLHHLEKADQGTLELLSFLLDGAGVVAPQGPSLRALFVGSVRTDASEAGALSELRASERATTLRVGTLDVEGIRAYLQSPEALARVLARTGGMPEAIDLLLEGDPLTPEERLVRRLGSLTAPGRALLEALAVLGRPADIDELARIAGLDVDAASRASFAACDLLTRSIVDGRILFCFERDGDASRAYDALRPEQRRALHGRWARACADSVAPH